MNDIRRTILWVIFGFSMVLLWDQWKVANGQKPTFFPTQNQSAAAKSAAGSSGSTSSDLPLSSAPASVSSGASQVPAANPANVVNSAVLPAGAPSAALQSAREKLTVSTDVFSLMFDTEGGALVKSSFNKFKDMADKTSGFVLLDESAGRVYLAQTGLIPAAGGVALPTHKTPMVVGAGPRSLADGQNELQIKFESPEVGGVKLIKTYTLRRGAYDISVDRKSVV